MVPELPEVQAHAERLTERFGGHVLNKFVPITFTALKTAVPQPRDAYGLPLQNVGRRGKYLLLQFEPVTFVVHLMQGGRLLVDEKQSAKPRGGQARFVFEPDLDAPSNPALLLTRFWKFRHCGWERCLVTAPPSSLTPLISQRSTALGGSPTCWARAASTWHILSKNASPNRRS